MIKLRRTLVLLSWYVYSTCLLMLDILFVTLGSCMTLSWRMQLYWFRKTLGWNKLCLSIAVRFSTEVIGSRSRRQVGTKPADSGALNVNPLYTYVVHFWYRWFLSAILIVNLCLIIVNVSNNVAGNKAQKHAIRWRLIRHCVMWKIFDKRLKHWNVEIVVNGTLLKRIDIWLTLVNVPS